MDVARVLKTLITLTILRCYFTNTKTDLGSKASTSGGEEFQPLI